MQLDHSMSEYRSVRQHYRKYLTLNLDWREIMSWTRNKQIKILRDSNKDLRFWPLGYFTCGILGGFFKIIMKKNPYLHISGKELELSFNMVILPAFWIENNLVNDLWNRSFETLKIPTFGLLAAILQVFFIIIFKDYLSQFRSLNWPKQPHIH